jgi:hypothetical protein
MRTFAWTVVLAALLIPAVAWADGPAGGKGTEASPPGGPPDQAKAMADLQRQQMEMELEARRGEIQFQGERRKLEIEKQQAEIEMIRHRMAGMHRSGQMGGLVALVMLGCLVSHILLTVWVCKDMNEKKIARALWVPIILLIGPAGAILYALVRLADLRDLSAAPAGKAR